MRIAPVIMTIAMAVAAFAADVTGKWKATTEGPNGSMEITFDLKVEGNKITGKAISEMGEMSITDGTIDGDNFRFTVETDQFKVVHKGTVSGNEMRLKVDMGDNSVEMVAKRIGS